MIAEKVFYAALFMAEAITAWLYFNYIYTQTAKNIRVFASYALGYALLFGLAQLDSVILNVGSFFVINAILLAINYSCEVKSAILHAAFLTLLMSIAEILITVIVDDYTAYTYSMSAFVSLVGFSKLLYFLLTILAARLFKPHKNWNEEPSQIVLLCFMPLVSVVIIVTFIYIGITGQLTSLTEVLVSVSVVALLLVNIIVLFIYNRIQSMDRENAALQMSRLRDQADAEYYGMLQQQYDGQNDGHDLTQQRRAAHGQRPGQHAAAAQCLPVGPKPAYEPGGQIIRPAAQQQMAQCAHQQRQHRHAHRPQDHRAALVPQLDTGDDRQCRRGQIISVAQRPPQHLGRERQQQRVHVEIAHQNAQRQQGAHHAAHDAGGGVIGGRLGLGHRLAPLAAAVFLLCRCHRLPHFTACKTSVSTPTAQQ